MVRKVFSEVYAEHTGKVSDKWSSYLQEYDRIFSQFRESRICLLEVGIQNGGSLEILSKYFTKAQAIIGCDINENCHLLNYEDGRIKVVVGDIKTQKTIEQILQLSKKFEIIIDDGSHTSSDIISTFLLYFPYLVEGGVFIVEDLHCSYWSTFEGGLFNPRSAISFFKTLIDLINNEHWNVPIERNFLLRRLIEKYNCDVDISSLCQIHSIEFVNSMCIVHKSAEASNKLGHRVIVGSTELVVQGHLHLGGELYKSDLVSNVPYSRWDFRDANLEESLLENEEKLAQAKQSLLENEEKLAQAKQSLLENEEKLAQANQLNRAYHESISWKITSPLRLFGRIVNGIKFLYKFIFLIACNHSEIYAIATKIKKNGFGFLYNRIKLIQSEEYSRQVIVNRGMSPEFLGVLIFISTKLIKLKRWIDRDAVRKEYLERSLSVLRGEIWDIKKTLCSNLKIHIENPKKLFEIVGTDFLVSGWSVDVNKLTAGNIRVRVGSVQCPLVLVDREDVKNCYPPNYLFKGQLGFKTALQLSFGLNVCRIEIQDIDGIWKTVKRSFLLRIPEVLVMKISDLHSYDDFVNWEQKNLKQELIELKQHIGIMIYKPIFIVVIDTRSGDLDFDNSLKSVLEQIYSLYEIYVLSNTGIAKLFPNGSMDKPYELSFSELPGDFIIFLSGGQQLASVALYEFANAINQDPEVDLIYGDEDFLLKVGKRSRPFWKPDWSPDYLETFNYIGFPSCYRLALLRNFLCPINQYDLVLQFTELTSKIRHIPKILGHNSFHISEKSNLTSEISASNLMALKGRLDRTGRTGIVREHNKHKGCYEISLNERSEPLISVVIPTAGKIIEMEDRRIDLIVNIVRQIRNSSYKNIEIIIVDNGDLAKNQICELKSNNCILISYKEPIFNISKKLNLGASVAKGRLLLLMNDDIEVISPDWIGRMAEHFEKPHVGVVGAKLLYPDETIQHVGIVHNFGKPDHVRKLYPRADAGYFFSTCGTHNYLAVTGAVMMTLRDIYWNIGGYSEELAVSFNDVDFCLKVQELALTVVYAPQAELIHMESLSCTRKEANIKELSWFVTRWAAKLTYDPFYNEQFLTVARPTFELSINKRLL